MELSAKGQQFIANWEGTKRNAEGLHIPYKCPAGKWTLGYGEVITGAQVEQFKAGITDEYAALRFKNKLKPFVDAMNKAVKVPVSQNQFDMLVSIAYNNGSAAITGSTLMRLLNKKDYKGAGEQFLKWCHIGKDVCDGLLRRRKAERLIFNTEDKQ